MADISCGMKTVKLFLMIFNLMFVIVGIAVLGVGITVTLLISNVTEITGESIIITPVIIILIGVIVLLVAVFGFMGTVRDNRCIIIVYASFLSVLLIVQFGCICAALVLRDKVGAIIQKDLKAAITKTNGTTVDNAVNFIQTKFQCCGVNDSTDFTAVVPVSCCKDGEKCDTSNSTLLFSKGCYPVLKEEFKSKLLIVGGIILLVFLVEIVCITFGCALANALKGYEPV